MVRSVVHQYGSVSQSALSHIAMSLTSNCTLHLHQNRIDVCLHHDSHPDPYCLLRTRPASKNAECKSGCEVLPEPAIQCGIAFDRLSGGLMDRIWTEAGRRDYGIREIYAARLAHTLLGQGVAEFATRNPRFSFATGLRASGIRLTGPERMAGGSVNRHR